MNDATIYPLLRESHEIQRAIFRRLLRSKPGSQLRRDLVSMARHELAAHEAAEERYLYVPMMLHDLGLAASRHALHEHHQIDEAVEQLQALDPAGDAWIEQAKALSHRVHHHLREEEQKFFQVSGKLLSNTQKLRLAGQYRRDYQRMHRLLAAGLVGANDSAQVGYRTDLATRIKDLGKLTGPRRAQGEPSKPNSAINWRSTMNMNQIKGRASEAKGKIKEVAGHATGNKTMELKGKTEKHAGKAEAKYGDLKSDAKRATT